MVVRGVRGACLCDRERVEAVPARRLSVLDYADRSPPGPESGHWSERRDGSGPAGGEEPRATRRGALWRFRRLRLRSEPHQRTSDPVQVAGHRRTLRPAVLRARYTTANARCHGDLSLLSATRNEADVLFLKAVSFAAAQVMGEGPPGSVCRHGPQTAQMLLWSKRPWW